MQAKTVWVASALAACALVTAAPLLASSLAFRLNYRLNASAGAGGVGNGRNTLALPYIRQVSVR